MERECFRHSSVRLRSPRLDRGSSVSYLICGQLVKLLGADTLFADAKMKEGVIDSDALYHYGPGTP
jgi:hypothetical protein